jgi:hypothetical protein
MGMIRALMIAAIVMTVAACSGDDGGGGDHTGEASKAAPAADTSSAATAALGKALDVAADPNVTGCLQKVADGNLREAYPLCLKAASVDPDNNQVQAALAKSKESYAAAADAGKQAQDAARDMKKQAEDMKQGFTVP